MPIPITLQSQAGATLASLILTEEGLAFALAQAKDKLPAGIEVKSLRTSDGTLRIEAVVPVLGSVVANLALEAEPG